MSKAAKQSIIILGLLLIASLGLFGVTIMEKQKLESANAQLGQDLNATQSREQIALADIKKLKSDLDKAERDAADLNNRLSKEKEKANELLSRVDEISKDRDKYKDRIDNIKSDRDRLVEEVKNIKSDNDRLQRDLENVKTAALEQSMAAENVQEVKAPVRPTRKSSVSMDSTVDVGSSDEAYWAQLLKDKASLEMRVTELENELSDNSIEIVELTQAKTELEIELDSLTHAKEELDREIKHQEGLVNNLSLELARTKNDKKFISDRSEKLTAENSELRSQMKMLSSTKSALEKSILRITKDKQQIEGQLGQSETIIQSKIDEIWDIKDSLDKTLKNTSSASSTEGVELPPIVVSSNGQGTSFNNGMAHPGLNGKVLSLNADNNFVIVNVGQDAGVQVGDKLSVYRDSKYLASLEVIQVRKDIAAADIKDQWTKVQVGDLVQ